MAITISAVRRKDRNTVEPPSSSITHGEDIKNDTSLVGLKVATTRTVAGYTFNSTLAVSSFGSNLSGTGTSGDPYVIDRVQFTSTVTFSGTELTAKWFKFTNCEVVVNGNTTTVGGSSFITTSFAGGSGANAPAGIFVEGSTLHASGPMPTNGPQNGGTDKGIAANCPLRVTRCDISGACIPYYVACQSGVSSWLRESWLHDIWGVAVVDHTDIGNGNPSALNGEISRNFLNGNRGPGSQVVANGIAAYDDNGVITDWTIDSNYMMNCATGIISATNTTRFTNPYVITNNIFDTSTIGNLDSTRTPSTQSNNLSHTGAALTF